MADFLCISGETCSLRPYSKKDTSLLKAYADDTGVSSQLTFTFPSPYSVNDASNWIERNMQECDKLMRWFHELNQFNKQTTLTKTDRISGILTHPPVTEFALAVVDPMNDELIGNISLEVIETEPHAWEFGLWIGRRRWGKGVGTEALRLLLSMIWDHPGLDHSQQQNPLYHQIRRISAEIRASNHRSRRVAEKNGLLVEGHLSGAFLTNDRMSIEDSVLVATTRDRWLLMMNGRESMLKRLEWNVDSPSFLTGVLFGSLLTTVVISGFSWILFIQTEKKKTSKKTTH